MIYFISDLHFGHKNIINFSGESFSSIEERDETIIKNWNETVTNKDTVYVLGDISWRSQEETEAIFERLKGTIYIIQGNHDSPKMLSELKDKKLIKDFMSYYEINEDKKKYVLFHYPIEEWNKIFNNSALIHGHIHSKNFRSPVPATRVSNLRNVDGTPRKLLIRNHNKFDVGVEAVGYKPVSFDKIKESILDLEKMELKDYE